MRIGIRIDSAGTPELRVLLAEWSLLNDGVDGNKHNVVVRCNGPERWAAETDMVSLAPWEAAQLLRTLAARIEATTPEPLIKEADPELERLLDEEEHIQDHTDMTVAIVGCSLCTEESLRGVRR